MGSHFLVFLNGADLQDRNGKEMVSFKFPRTRSGEDKAIELIETYIRFSTGERKIWTNHERIKEEYSDIITEEVRGRYIPSIKEEV